MGVGQYGVNVVRVAMRTVLLALGFAVGGSAIRTQGHSHWLPHKLQTAAHYCSHGHHRRVFGNKKDFLPANAVLKQFFENSANVTLLMVGVNDGSHLDDVLHEDYYKAEKARVYGWEITEHVFEAAKAKFHGNREIELDHKAISDSDGTTVDISGSGETAGLYEPGPHGFQAAHETVTTLRWSTFVEQKGIKDISYALIDVEGHEMSVIAGMDLEGLRDTFPVFQYELGGTWVDGRHAGNMTQADAAQYLISLGYRIYLMGDHNGLPVLSPVGPSAFNDAWCVQEGGRFFIQGNALAVLERAAYRMPWLASAIDEMVANDAKLT